MSADGDDTPQQQRRRSSIAELFASRPPVDPSSAQGNNARPFQSSVASSVTQQAQQQSRTRRLSITTLGLSGSPNQATPATPFGTLKRGSGVGSMYGRRGSHDFNENAIDDEEPGPLSSSAPDSSGTTGPKPIGRRLSFGAKAYRDLRTGAGGNETSSDASSPASGSIKTSSPPTSRGSEGFNWSDNLMNRAKRTSISVMPASGIVGSSGVPVPTTNHHNRANTIAVGQQPPAPAAPKMLQKPPDHFQERILKGDFYMD